MGAQGFPDTVQCSVISVVDAKRPDVSHPVFTAADVADITFHHFVSTQFPIFQPVKLAKFAASQIPLKVQ